MGDRAHEDMELICHTDIKQFAYIEGLKTFYGTAANIGYRPSWLWDRIVPVRIDVQGQFKIIRFRFDYIINEASSLFDAVMFRQDEKVHGKLDEPFRIRLTFKKRVNI